MLYRDICKILGIFLFGFAFAFLPVIGIATYYEFFAPELHPQPHTTKAFVYSILITFALAALFYLIGRKSSGNIYRREGLIIVVLIWFIAPAIGALPFWISGTLNNPFQAYFEATSGLTTTGASAITAKQYDHTTGEEIPIVKTFFGVLNTTYTFWGNVEPIIDPQTGKAEFIGIDAVGKALLFWRSFIQWLGGLGIILLVISILPALGVGGKVMFQAELTGPIKSSLTPRLKETAGHLWKIYCGLTLMETSLLMITNKEMSFFDAITITFTTLSTGGFSIHNESIGFYQNSWTEWVVIAFMIAGAINFTLYFYALQGKLYRLYDTELLLFWAILLVGGILTVMFLNGTFRYPLIGTPGGHYSVEESIRLGTFQLVSAYTSTGFATANYDLWPYAVQVIFLVYSFVGAMAGSTAGGIKTIRHYMLFRIAQYKIESLFRPETIRTFRIGDREIDSGSAILVLCFFLTVVASAVLGTFLYVATGIDPETSIGLVACMLNNTGFAFRMAGPTETCGFLTNFQLILSSILMILGRLEYFAVLAILVPAFWKQK